MPELVHMAFLLELVKFGPNHAENKQRYILILDNGYQ